MLQCLQNLDSCRTWNIIIIIIFLNLQSHYNNDYYNNKIQKEEKKESKQEKKPTCKIYTTKLIIQLTIQRRMTYLHEHYVPWFSYHNIAYKSYIAVC